MKNYKGLTQKEVAKSLKLYGNNAFSEKKTKTIFELFINALKDQWLLILIGAALLKVVLLIVGLYVPALKGDGNWYELVSLLVAILLSSGFATYSEYTAEKQFTKLQNDEAAKEKVKVYRDGQLHELFIGDIVKDDIILVQTDDNIPIDGIILDGNLKVNQALINGESDDVEKLPYEQGELNSQDTFSKQHIFRGTIVTEGEAVIKAINIGDNTLAGSISVALQEDKKKSPSKEKLENLAQSIGKLGYTSGLTYVVLTLLLTYFGLNQLQTEPTNTFMLILSTVMYGVTIIIMAVPEGLPMMLSMLAGMNAKRLLSQNVLVRQPESIETAGYMNILFSDKTGTITQGLLSVVDLIILDEVIPAQSLPTLDKTYQNVLAMNLLLNNDAHIIDGHAVGGNNTDRALLNYISEFNYTLPDHEFVDKTAFTSSAKFADATYQFGDRTIKLIKGASERLIPDCQYVLDKQGNQIYLTDKIKQNLNKISEQQAARSMRILAIITEENNEKTLVALICIRDNVREDIIDTVTTMNKAGIQVVMVTGDRKETAIAIAKEAGILEHNNKDIVLTHDELEQLTDEQVADILPRLKVVARALPLDKKRLVNIAQNQHLVVAMTGDGVNDSPALKSADVGYALNDGTEGAKAASDVILVNNSLSSILTSILYGRTMTHSVQKFIIFQLTVNVSTIALSLLAPLSGIHEPFNIIVVLWINLVMDTLAALAYGQEPPLERYMDVPPVPRKANILTGYMKQSIATASLFIVAICGALMFNLFDIQNWLVNTTEHKHVTTFMLTFFIYAIIFNGFNTRSKGLNILENIGQNIRFLGVMTFIAIAQTLIIQYGGQIFDTVPMDVSHYLTALGLAACVIPLDMLKKLFVK